MAEKYLKKAVEIFLLFFLAFIPLVFFNHANDPFWIVEKFFLRFSSSILACIYLAHVFTSKKILLIKTPYNYLFLGFIALCLLGVFKASNDYAFIDRVFENICYLITAYIAFCFLLSAGTQDKTNKIIMLIVLSAVFMACYGISQSFGVDFLSWQSDFAKRAASTLGNPNFLAGHMVLVIPLCCAMIFAVRNRMLKFILLLSFVVLSTALLFTQTRGAYIGFIVSMLFFLALLLVYAEDEVKKYRLWIIGFCVAAACLAGIYLVKNQNAFMRIKEIVTLKDESTRIRALLWKNSLYLVSENPMLGSGAGNFYTRYPYYQSRALDPSYFKGNDFYRSGHSHNDFIQFAAEYGIPAAGILYFIFVLIFITGFKYLAKQGQDKFVVMGMLSGISALLVHAFFNFPFQIIPTTIIFYLFIVMLTFREKEFSSREARVNGPAGAAMPAIAIVFVAAAVISLDSLASDSYLRSAKEADYFKQPQNAESYAARAVQISPWNEDEQYYYGQMLEKQGKMPEAYRAYEQTLKINNTYWEAMPMVFQYYIEQGMREKALELGEKMYKISPYSRKAILSYAYACFINGRTDDALKVCETGLAYYPDDSSLLDQVSGTYGSIGNYDKALFYAQKAMQAEPGFANPYYNAGLSYYKMGNLKDARIMVEKMLSLDPASEKGKSLLEAIKHGK